MAAPEIAHLILADQDEYDIGAMTFIVSQETHIGYANRACLFKVFATLAPTPGGTEHT